MKKNLLIFVAMFLGINIANAQVGTVRGVVYDDELGETLPFSTIFVKEAQKGASTDLDGAFSIDLPVGIYTFDFSFVGMTTKSISEVEVKDGQVTELDVRLGNSTATLDEVVVTAKMIRNSESALLTLQKKSPNLMDGISKQTFRKIGDSDAGGAIKRVTGVSVEGGKYVYVRGLGDRYTKTILNGLDIPGLDPDRNTIQMDLFPTNLIDNMVVLKTATPDVSGDFTGGIIDIATKDFPVSRSFNISVSGSYNPAMNFNKNALTYPGSSTDWLGFDNGKRDLPINANQVIPTLANNSTALTTITERFDPVMGAEKTTSPMNFGVSVSTGDQINLKKATIGYNAAINYRNSTEFFEEVQYNFFIKGLNPATDYNFTLDQSQAGSLSKNNVMASGLAGMAVKWDKHKLSLNALHIQNGESTAGQFINEKFIFNSAVLYRDNLEYSERSISNVNLKGEHSFGASGGLKVDWSVAPTISKIEDKDVRVTPFRFEDDTFTIEPSEGADPLRLYRNLSEENLSGRIDITKKFVNKFGDAKLKFGASNVYKHRDYSILQYNVRVAGQTQLEINGDPNRLLAPENIWTVEKGIGSYIRGNFEPANTYDAVQTIAAGYVMSEMSLTSKLKAIYGLRLESFKHLYTGQSNLGDEVYDNVEINSSIDLLPSANLVYALRENTNLRFAATRTLARPSFKEASISQIYDALSGVTFIGNLQLETTRITNLDVRYERFGENGQMLSLSGFYKMFQDPIEVVAYSQLAPNNITPRNVGQANVMGAEFEIRQNLGIETAGEKPFSVGSNFTYVYSSVEMNPNEFLSRVENARANEEIKNTRRLQGQSPYIANIFFNYSSEEKGIEGNLSYNVQGKRLSVVGLGRNPDIFEMPFNALNMKVSKRFGKEQRGSVSFNGQNLLNAKLRKYYQGFNADSEIYQLFKPGVQLGFSVGYAL